MPIRLPQKTASSGTVLLSPSPGTWRARVLKHPPVLPPIYERIGEGTGDSVQKHVCNMWHCSTITRSRILSNMSEFTSETKEENRPFGMAIRPSYSNELCSNRIKNMSI